MPDLDDVPKVLSTPGSVLPEFYYDLVARILPGTLLLFCWYSLFCGENRDLGTILRDMKPATALDAVIGALVWGAGAYVLGLALTLPQRILRELGLRMIDTPGDADAPKAPEAQSRWLRLWNRAKHLWNQIRRGQGGVTPSQLKRLHDILKTNVPQAEFVLPKMSAEAGLFQQLSMGLFILFCGTLGSNVFAGSHFSAAVILCLLGGSLATGIVGYFRYRAFVDRHFSFLDTLWFSGRPLPAGTADQYLSDVRKRLLGLDDAKEKPANHHQAQGANDWPNRHAEHNATHQGV